MKRTTVRAITVLLAVSLAAALASCGSAPAESGPETDASRPAAQTDESSPLYGMPIINAYEARTVFVLKRGKGTGFSGIENPLFTNDNTVMLYGDAKQTVSSLVSEFEDA